MIGTSPQRCTRREAVCCMRTFARFHGLYWYCFLTTQTRIFFFFFLLLFWRHFFIQAHKIRLKTGDVWEWRQQPQLVYTCTSPLKRRCAASTRSITLYLCASDTKNATKVTFKERKAAGGDGLNINVSHRLCPILTLAWSDVALLRGLTLLQL